MKDYIVREIWVIKTKYIHILFTIKIPPRHKFDLYISGLGYFLIHHLFDFSYLMVSENNNNAPISQKKKRYSPFFFIRSPTPEIESPFTYRYQETEGEANFINTDGRDMSQLVEPGGPEPGTKIQFRGSPRLFIKGYWHCKFAKLGPHWITLVVILVGMGNF